MRFKKDDNGNFALTESGLLIEVRDDGSEKPYDADAKARQIAELTEKASKRGAELEKLNARYAALADIEDIAAYIEEHKRNAETVASLADKDRENEAKVQKRISDAVKAATTPITSERDELKAKLAKSEASLNEAVIGNAFANSAYVNERLQNAIGAQQFFGKAFYVKDGKPVGRDQ